MAKISHPIPVEVPSWHHEFPLRWPQIDHTQPASVRNYALRTWPESLGKKVASMLSARSARLRIFDLRGQKVILDCDLAAYYVVTLARLNSTCRLGAKRFNNNTRFRLTQEEYAKFTARHGSIDRKRRLPYAFTARGARIAAELLGTPAAAFMGGTIARAFRKNAHAAKKIIGALPEDRLQMTDEFRAQIENSERQMASGRRPRTRSSELRAGIETARAQVRRGEGQPVEQVRKLVGAWVSPSPRHSRRP